ncbi:MAG: helix-turn-helix transcriptional regulator, partial [Clostridia bacterium]|nr:helix-turn-helix transcriptional regulator [Clostridia bacterium]
MIFSNVTLSGIDNVLHFTAQSMRFSSYKRRNHIIGLQLSGSALHRFPDRNFTLRENSLYFFNEDEDYQVEILETGVAFSIHFTTFTPISMPSFTIPAEEPGRILSLLQSLERQYNNGLSRSARFASDFYKLLSIYEDMYQTKYAPSNHKLEEAISYLGLHFREKDCLEKAALLFGLSRRRFNDLFKQRYNLTPNQYVIQKKIS